jgi:para-aminobenzoate synthetase/4-amino-4-deoxychorismate lyase
MRLEAGTLARLDRHLRRARGGAAAFGFTWDEGRIQAALEQACAAHQDGAWRCRLLVGRNGAPSVECHAHADTDRPWRVAAAAEPIHGPEVFLRHKTTNRAIYDSARACRPDADDVLLWNARGELTESTIANLVVEVAGRKITPPVSSGLLAGVFRAELLERGVIEEGLVMRDALRGGQPLWLINSLRGWIQATLIT